MDVGRFNSEGYYDPVPYEAIRNADAVKYRPMVYICSPFAGDTQGNTEKARRYSRFAADMGTIPIAPHLLFPQFLSEETERDLALFMGMVLLGKCEQLWVFGGRVSEGMQKEIDKAKRRNIKIRWFSESLEEEQT